MYTRFYGLEALPFELNPDPKYLMMTARHREALANLQHGILARKSLTVITGEAGTGKTTLVNAALTSPACRDARIVHLANSTLTRDEFVEFLARSFQLSGTAAHSKATLLRELEHELKQRLAQGIVTALVIDEAQCLERDLLEEIRLLSNVETPSDKLLPLVLVGQPEFADRLNLPSMRQLKQRIALRCELGTFSMAETAAYVAGRIRTAGGDASTMFTREAIEEVHRGSQGIPRTISVICDNALVSGFALGVKPITAPIVRDVCADFDLGREPAFPVYHAPGAPGAVPADGPVKAPAGTPADAATANPGRTDRAPATRAEHRPMFGAFSRKRRFSFF